LGMRTICVCAQESLTTTAGCVVERSFWHPKALRWSCTLFIYLILHLVTFFNSKSKIGSERTPFGIKRIHPEVCNAGLKTISNKMRSRSATNNGSTALKGEGRHKGCTLKVTTL
jgi:hypothetical protein